MRPSIALAFLPIVAASAQTPAPSVPFVGCKSSGQTETLDAPTGTSPRLTMSPKDADALAYYKSADGIGVLAPRGWYCEGVSGSGGAALFVSPKPIHGGASPWEGVTGPAIEVNHINSENSGRYEVAEIMARVFPEYRAFAARVMRGMDLAVPTRPFPEDTVTYRDRTAIEYTTPARTEGLGNFHSWLGKNDLPIRGAAILVGDPRGVGSGPDVVLLSVRLPRSLTGLTPLIIAQFKRD